MTYKVKLSKFEGPMELLLELIEKEKLEITEFSLSEVADEYLDYIKEAENIHLENLADFLAVASRLILIKSRALLPMLRFSDEEEEEIKDLTQQLEEYKKFKEASIRLGKIAERRSICYSREGFSQIEPIFYPPKEVNVFDLKKYFAAVLGEIPVIKKLEEEVVGDIVTLEEKIDDLQNFLRSKIESSFSSLVEGATDKVDVIVSFLAMLEMIKQRIVDAKQDNLFTDIKLSVRKV